MGQMRKPKSGEPSLREKLSKRFLEALEADFQAYGIAVLEKMRESSPERYCELAAKMIMSSEPQKELKGIAAATNSHEMGRIYLQQVGLLDPSDAQVEQAVAAADAFIAQLEAIRDRAQFGESGNGHAAPIGTS
jgi:hypothetical protein